MEPCSFFFPVWRGAYGSLDCLGWDGDANSYCGKYEQIFGDFVVLEDSGVSYTDVFRLTLLNLYLGMRIPIAYLRMPCPYCSEKQTDPKILHNSCN